MGALTKPDIYLSTSTCYAGDKKLHNQISIKYVSQSATFVTAETEAGQTAEGYKYLTYL